MSCIWNVPREERHCEYCLAYCEERPQQEVSFATNTATPTPIPNETITLDGTGNRIEDNMLYPSTAK